MPRALDQWLNSISIEEIRLLHLVHSEAERTSRSEVVLSTDVICKRTGINKANIGKARQGLVDYGLLLYRKDGRQFTYIVVDPKTKKPVVDKTSLAKLDLNAIPASGPNTRRQFYRTMGSRYRVGFPDIAHCLTILTPQLHSPWM